MLARAIRASLLRDAEGNEDGGRDGARLTLRDGKPRYLADTPRFIGYIRSSAARYRELAPLLRLVDHIEGHSAPVGYAFGRM